MNMRDPYSAERDVIRVIDRFTRKHARPPSYSEMAKTLKMTRGGIGKVVDRLVKKGFIEHGAAQIRDLRLPEKLAKILKAHAAAFVFQTEVEKRRAQQSDGRRSKLRAKARPAKSISQLPERAKQFLTAQKIGHELHDPPFNTPTSQMSFTAPARDFLDRQGVHVKPAAKDKTEQLLRQAPDNAERLRAQFFSAVMDRDYAGMDHYLDTVMEGNTPDVNRTVLELAFSMAAAGHQDPLVAEKILRNAAKAGMPSVDFARIAERFDAKPLYDRIGRPAPVAVS